MKKVIIISTSLRAKSNSEILAHEVERGAADAGHQVEFVTLKDKTIGFCKGCFACHKLGKCIIKDDVNELMAKVLESDVVVWATPIYYYEMSGSMKTLIDRFNALYNLDYKFRETYLVATAAEDEETTFDTAISGLNGWIDCFEKLEYKGIVSGGGINEMNDAPNHPEVMKKAYELGKKI